jgi:hypothetical protein
VLLVEPRTVPIALTFAHVSMDAHVLVLQAPIRRRKSLMV